MWGSERLGFTMGRAPPGGRAECTAFVTLQRAHSAALPAVQDIGLVSHR
eukprot:COSAG06_NODE_19145_length_851_cov_1.896277_1_plen_48_part_10